MIDDHNLLVRDARGSTVDKPPMKNRRWIAALLLVGAALHVYAAVNSDLGLDAHVRLNALTDERSPEHDLPWGAPRISGDSNGAGGGIYSGFIPPWNTSEKAMKVTSVAAVFCLAMVVSVRPKWTTHAERFDPMFAVLVLLSPVMVFSSSRGYDEAALSLMMSLGVLGYWFNRGDTTSACRLNSLLMATAIFMILGWKGFSLVASGGVWLVLVVASEIYLFASHRWEGTPIGAMFVHPWKMGLLSSTVVYVAVAVFGFVASSGTFSIVGEHPGRFFIASLFAIFDAVVLYLLVGCLLWSLLPGRWRGLYEARGRGVTMLTVYIGAVLSGVVAYIGTLWTLESSLWGMKLTEVMVVLGNNGRYATVVIVPMVMLLRWVEPTAHAAPKRPSAQMIAVLVVAPFLIFTGAIGHQIWSEDAGEALSSQWSSEHDSFLLIASESMAMHHLYVIKSNIDLVGERNITGSWATPETAEEWIESAGNSVDFLLLGPDVSFTVDETAWGLIEKRAVPVVVPGGIQDGSWSLYGTRA